MSTEVKTVKRAYLINKDQRTGIHTAYTAAPGMPSDPTRPQPLLRLDFLWGVARDVPQTTFDAFKAIGLVTDQRPRRADEEDD